jgi:transcriptional regulator with XRE-family HTH domain
MTRHPIERARLAQGLSRRALAHALGISHVTVWRWETQGIIPEIPMLLRLAQFLGVPALELAPELSAVLSGEAVTQKG